MASPAGLDDWWTLDSRGTPALSAMYQLGFGPAYQWTGEVTRCEEPRAFEWTMRKADADWEGTRVGFTLAETDHGVQVEFYHCGWPEANAHFRTSACCWSSYLRILRRRLEHGERVPYDIRLDV